VANLVKVRKLANRYSLLAIIYYSSKLHKIFIMREWSLLRDAAEKMSEGFFSRHAQTHPSKARVATRSPPPIKPSAAQRSAAQKQPKRSPGTCHVPCDPDETTCAAKVTSPLCHDPMRQRPPKTDARQNSRRLPTNWKRFRRCCSTKGRVVACRHDCGDEGVAAPGWFTYRLFFSQIS